jgi:hypothetical protein
MTIPAISFVQSALVLNGTTVPFATVNTAGNAIIVLVLQQGINATSTSFSVTDTSGNSYRSLGFTGNGVSGNNAAVGEMFCSFNIAGGGNTVTAQASSGVPGTVITVEISGVNAVDVSGAGIGTGNAPSSGSVNTNAASEFLFGWEMGGALAQNFVTGAADWTTVQNGTSFIVQYQIVSAQGTYAFQPVTSTSKGNLNQWVSQIATLFFADAAQPRVQGVSQASVGTLLYPNYNNIAWSQPLGPGTAVLPAQTNGPFTAFPVPGMVIQDAGQALWHLGCGHGVDVIRMFKEFDTDTQTQCAVIACSICSFIVSLISPYDDAIISFNMTLHFPIVVP